MESCPAASQRLEQTEMVIFGSGRRPNDAMTVLTTSPRHMQVARMSRQLG